MHFFTGSLSQRGIICSHFFSSISFPTRRYLLKTQHKKNEETGQVEGKRKSSRLKEDLTQDLRVNLDLQFIYCSQTPHQKWPPWKGDCQEAVLKEGKQEEKAELCQMTQGVDWKSAGLGYYYFQELWKVLQKPWRTIIKYCISIYVCTRFSKPLQQFPVFLEMYKEIRVGWRLLLSTLCNNYVVTVNVGWCNKR